MLKIWRLMSFTRVASHHQCCLSTAALKVHICWAFQQDSCYIHIASLCYNMEKKNIQNIHYTVSMWQTYVGMKHSTDIFELFMFQATDNRLEALEQSIRTIILFKYYHVLILLSCNQKLIGGFQPLMSFCCNLLIWSIQIMEGGFTSKKVLTEKDKNRECLRTCNHERRQTKLIRWINSLPTESFKKKNWAIYLRQKMGKLANIM